MAKRSDAPATRRGPRGGFGWLILFLVIGGLLALFIFQPEVFDDLLGSPGEPGALGEAPINTSAPSANVRTRSVSMEPRGYRQDATALAAVEDDDGEDETEPDAPVVEDTQGPEHEDLARGKELLAEMDEAYHRYQWDRVDSLASRLVDLDVPKRLRARAEEMRHYSRALENLFEKLGNKEELLRNVETNPNALVVKIRGTADIFVPLTDYAAQEVYAGDDPVGFVKGQLQGGKVALMDTSFIPTEVGADIVDTVAAANTERIRNGRRERFEQNLAKIRNSELFKGDAIAWYNAGRYAYRNRLDAHVVDLLEQAIARDPELARTIREDKASDLYAKMMLNLEADERRRASGWLLKLKNQYGDTSIYKQAQAHYNGNLERLRREQETARQARRERRRKAREERLARARAREDEEAVEEIEEEEDVYEGPAVADAGPVTGDEAQADAYYDEAYGYYRQASGMTATHERDRLYGQAKGLFEKAMNIYNREVKNGNSNCQQKLINANMYRYHCIKMMRPSF